MNYLEVKYEVKQKKDLSNRDFISNVINSQKSLGTEIRPSSFEHDKLIELGFVRNTVTKGYGLLKNLSLQEIKKLAIEIDKLDSHILTHGYIVIKVYEGEIYFWDTALIYEGLDTFEYCLKYHNIISLDGLNVVSKFNSISEELLYLIGYTKRYEQPSLDFITEGLLWDKKNSVKVLKSFVQKKDEIIKIREANIY